MLDLAACTRNNEVEKLQLNRQRGASSRPRRARSTPICMRTEPGLFGNAPLTHGELHKAANHDSQIKHRSGSSYLTAYVAVCKARANRVGALWNTTPSIPIT